MAAGVALDKEIGGLLFGAVLRSGTFTGEDFAVDAEAAANSNVGKFALAAFSLWLSGSAEPRGVALGSANLKSLVATSVGFDSLLGRDLREDEPTVFGRLKFSSDLVGDVDHF